MAATDVISDAAMRERELDDAKRLWSAEIHLRFPIARDHAIIFKFNSPFRIVTGNKLVAGHLRMAPEGLFQGLPACGVHDRPSGPPRSCRNSR